MQTQSVTSQGSRQFFPLYDEQINQVKEYLAEIQSYNKARERGQHAIQKLTAEIMETADEMAALEKKARALDRQASAQLVECREYHGRQQEALVALQAKLDQVSPPRGLQTILRSLCLPLRGRMEKRLANALTPFCNNEGEAAQLASQVVCSNNQMLRLISEHPSFGLEDYAAMFEQIVADQPICRFQTAA